MNYSITDPLFIMTSACAIVIASCGPKKSDRLGQRMAPSVQSAAATPDSSPTGEQYDESSDDALPATDEDAEYKKLLQSCGGIDPAQPDKLVVNQPLRAIPVRQSGTETVVLLPVKYKVDFDGDLLIQSSINKNEITRTLNLLNAQPSIVAGMARDRLAAQSGMLITDYLSYSDRATLTDVDPVWNGVTCTIQPASRTVNTVGKRVVVVYDKPLPIHISPIAARERYEMEINHARHWELNATVVESENPSLKVGQVIPGTVDIEPVSNQQNIPMIDGSVVTVASDTGIRIRIKFGTDAITNMMGLTPDSTYLVDHTTHLFHSITADLKDGESPIVTFVTPEALP